MNKEIKNIELNIDKALNIADVIDLLSLKINKIAKETGTDESRLLFRITGNYIEVYEIDVTEEIVKCFLGRFSLNNL